MTTPHRELDAAAAARLVRFPLECVGREYPNLIHHPLSGDEDVRPPRELTPAFFGCFDWHSAVHGHWTLVRLLRFFPEADWAAEAHSALKRNLTPANLAAEAAYLAAPGRSGFERPYGLAWLLQLAAEVREWNNDPPMHSVAAFRLGAQLFEPLECLAVERFSDWLPKLSWPIRSGEHRQTAFAMGLALDWARTAGDAAFGRLLCSRVEDFHRGDRGCPLDYEPSGHDFLSPCLATADLVRRVLRPREFADWFEAFLPGVPSDGATNWLCPVACSDPSEGKLAHLDGLNLSRAWMLEGIAASLPAGDPRCPAISATADEHRAAGLASITGEHYAATHWLATFAVYLLTRRGIAIA